MLLKGKVYIFGNDVNTDEIIPARYLNTTDPVILAQYCMEDSRPGFGKSVEPGSIIIAGENFGCGSSREHAPISRAQRSRASSPSLLRGYFSGTASTSGSRSSRTRRFRRSSRKAISFPWTSMRESQASEVKRSRSIRFPHSCRES
jgi:hypothetical protein